MHLDSTIHNQKKIAIMQPYLFPYIGYFQLIDAVDDFVFYDDVTFTRKGWINRNRILCNGQEHLFTIPVINKSFNIEIKDTSCEITEKWRDKFLKKIEHNYKKCIHYPETMSIILDVIEPGVKLTSELSTQSIKSVCEYLKIEKVFLKSSEFSPETKGIGKVERLCEITKKLKSYQYLNSIGGQKLYQKKTFRENGVELLFLSTNEITYKQTGIKSHIPNLSIIDVLMNNDIPSAVNLIKEYRLL